jgi:hypothetical protein
MSQMKIKLIIKSVLYQEPSYLCSCLRESEDFFICFESDFDPVANVKEMIHLFEYCKPLLASQSKQDYHKICEELFSTLNVKIVPFEKRDYDNFCIIDLNEEAYIFIKLYKLIKNVLTCDVKEWLELHYPKEQFINDDHQVDKEGLEIYSLISETNLEFSKILDKKVVSYVL